MPVTGICCQSGSVGKRTRDSSVSSVFRRIGKTILTALYGSVNAPHHDGVADGGLDAKIPFCSLLGNSGIVGASCHNGQEHGRNKVSDCADSVFHTSNQGLLSSSFSRLISVRASSQGCTSAFIRKALFPSSLMASFRFVILPASKLMFD